VALGNLFLFTGRHEEALDEFQQALASNPDNVSALSGTGTIYAELQQPDKAEEILRRATGLQPGNWNPYNRLGAFYFNQGRYADAAEQYEIVVALDNTNMIGQSNLAMAYIYAGDYEKSVPVLESVAEVEPRAITLSNLGLAYYYLGRLDEAISAHTRATEIAPNDHVAWSGLGDALWAAGNEAESIAAYEQAEALAAETLQVNPNDAYTQLDLAWINAMLGRHVEARQFLERAQTIATIDPVFHYIDALIHVRAGRADEAIGALELAIDNGFSEKTLAVEPLLAPLRSDPRFAALVSGPGAP